MMVHEDTQPTPTCATCGSDNVTLDASASWNDKWQRWELCEVGEQAYCGECQTPTTLADPELERSNECHHPPEHRQLTPWQRFDRKTIVRHHRCKVCGSKRTQQQIQHGNGTASEVVGDWWKLTDEQRARDREAWSEHAIAEAVGALGNHVVAEREPGMQNYQLLIGGQVVGDARSEWHDGDDRFNLGLDLQGGQVYVDTLDEAIGAVARHYFETGREVIPQALP